MLASCHSSRVFGNTRAPMLNNTSLKSLDEMPCGAGCCVWEHEGNETRKSTYHQTSQNRASKRALRTLRVPVLGGLSNQCASPLGRALDPPAKAAVMRFRPHPFGVVVDRPCPPSNTLEPGTVLAWGGRGQGFTSHGRESPKRMRSDWVRVRCCFLQSPLFVISNQSSQIRGGLTDMPGFRKEDAALLVCECARARQHSPDNITRDECGESAH